MTAAEPVAGRPRTAPRTPPSVSSFRRTLIFGTGLGIAPGTKNLEAVIVRSRATGPKIVAAATIHDFRSRPAAEWGSELARFLSNAHEKHLTATLLLPRDEVIVRTLQLPGVADKDVPAAIELQIENLHPFGDEEVVWASMRVNGATIAVGVVRKEVLSGYETLFSEAGIGLAGVSFSASAIHAALRIWSAASASLLVYMPDERGRVELYGESPARPLYSAEFSLRSERALAIARAELRLDTEYPAQSLHEVLPRSLRPHAAWSPLAYAAALAVSASLVTKIANLLPAERRASNARKQYLLPVLLTSLLLIALLVGFVVLPAIERRNYLDGLNAEVHRLEPLAQRAQLLERRINADRVKIAALDDFRRRPQADLDVLNELARILPPQVWTNTIEIYTDNVVLSGEADQAAPLLKLLDSSPLFQNSDFALSVTRSNPKEGEQFRIKTMRRGRAGRTTP